MERPVDYFDIHLQNQATREARLLMRYYMISVYPLSLTADRKQIRSLVMQVVPASKLTEFFNGPFILKIQPADTVHAFESSKTEIVVHWLVTQLTTLALRSRVGAEKITDPREMLNAVLNTQCCNVVRLFDWSAEYYDPDFAREKRAAGSTEYRQAVKQLEAYLTPSGLSIPDGFRTVGEPRVGKTPRIMAALMEYGGTTLTAKLSDMNSLVDSYLLPILAQEVQMLNALLVAHMSHLDSHTDNRFISDATNAMSSLGFFYYHLSEEEVLRIPPSVSHFSGSTLVLLKWADFGFSAIHTKDTQNVPWRITPYDRFESLRTPGRFPRLDKAAGVSLSPAYDMLRFATSVLLSVFSTLSKRSDDEIGQTLRRMDKSYKILVAMIDVSRSLVERMQEYVTIEGVLRDIGAQFRSDSDFGEPYDEFFAKFSKAAQSNEWTFGTASTFDAVTVWPLEFLRTHFADYIKTPAEVEAALAAHRTDVMCADMTLRHSPGRANRFFPERQKRDAAPRAAYNHNARAIAIPEK
jgi:hypothetical protein